MKCSTTFPLGAVHTPSHRHSPWIFYRLLSRQPRKCVLPKIKCPKNSRIYMVIVLLFTNYHMSMCALCLQVLMSIIWISLLVMLASWWAFPMGWERCLEWCVLWLLEPWLNTRYNKLICHTVVTVFAYINIGTFNGLFY